MRHPGLCLVCSVLVTSVSAQIKVQSFDSRDGLCQSHVFCIGEDNLGYLWFGTYDGVSRWDGLEFRNIDGLPSVGVRTIYRADDDTLYFGTTDGLYGYRNGDFFRPQASDSLRGYDITALHKGPDRILYIGTARNGAWRLHRGRLEQIERLAGSSVHAIAPGPGKELFFCTDSGVYCLAQAITAVPELQHEEVTCMLAAADGTLYFGTIASGIRVQRGGNWDSLSGLSHDRIRDLCQDDDGRIYIATFGGGVYIAGPAGMEHLGEENGLANNAVFDIHMGSDGSAYFGTHGGISVYRRSRIEIFNEETGLSKNYVMAVYPGTDNTLYVGTFGGGVSVLRGSSWNTLDGMANDNVLAIYPRNLEVYFATFRGLRRYREGDLTTFTVADGLLSNMISSMTDGEDGTLFLGSDRGVNTLKTGRIGVLEGVDEPVNALCMDGPSRLYIGTDSGLRCFDLDRGEFLPRSTPIDSMEICSMLRGEEGGLYFGTANGLYSLVHGEWDSLTLEHGLSHKRIEGLVQDRSGRLYLTTMRGINIVDKERRIRVLRNSDGISSEECTPNSCCRDVSGCLWFGTIRGLTRYDPSLDRPDPDPPRVHLLRVRVFDREVSLGSPADFEHDQNYIKWDYFGIYLAAPHKVRYRVRLEGLEPEWIETDQTFMQYANLDDGDYSFQVMACNDWGAWSEPVTYPFTIRPPFWKQWWFIFGMVLITGGILFYLITLRVKSLLAVERLRTKIAADLHDNIGASLTEISILSEVGTRQLGQDTERARTSLSRISEIARSLVDSMSDIVWLVNPKQDSLYDLMLRLKDAYTDLFTSKGIMFHSNNLKVLDDVHLPMEYRQHLFLTFKEAIHNSIKHSRCSEIELNAAVKNKILRITLNDNGCGFAVDRNRTGHGLASMRRRAKMIGGDLIVETRSRGGTAITFEGKIR